MRLLEANLVGQELRQLQLNSCRITLGTNQIGWLSFDKVGKPASYTERFKYHLYDGTYYNVFWLSDLSYDKFTNVTRYKCFDFNGVLAQRIVAYDGLIEGYGKSTNAKLDDIVLAILTKNYTAPNLSERNINLSHGISIKAYSASVGEVVTYTYGWLNGLKAIQEIWKASNGRVNLFYKWESTYRASIYIFLDYFKDRTIYGNNPLVFNEADMSKSTLDASFSKEINTVYAMSNKYVSGYKMGSVVETVNNTFRIEGYVGNSSAKTVAETAPYGQQTIYANRPFEQELSELILNKLQLGLDYDIGTAISVKQGTQITNNVIRGLDIMYKSVRTKNVRARVEKFKSASEAVTARTYGSSDTPIIS